MAQYTSRFGFSYFGPGVPGNLVEEGGKFTLLDPQVLANVLAALEDHKHTGGEQLADPVDEPAAVRSDLGGELPAGRTYYYAATFVDAYNLETAASPRVDVETPAPVETPDPPKLRADTGTTANPGKLKAEYTSYALTVLVFRTPTAVEGQLGIQVVQSQETTLSVPVPITPPVNGRVILTLPDMPEGGHEFRVWRKSYLDPGYTRIGTVGPDVEFIDDGSVVADPYACNPINFPPATNTTNAASQVKVTLSAQDVYTLHDPEQGAVGWRLYRSENPSVFPARSLVAQITGKDDDGKILTSFTDIGEDLQVGAPPRVSTTFTPTGRMPTGHGALPDPDDLDYPDDLLWVDDAEQLHLLVRTGTTRAWAPLASPLVPGSIKDEHIAGDAAIVMGKLALDPLLTRVTTLETTVAAGGGGGGEGGPDVTAVHYRGPWENLAYAANDLVTSAGKFYLARESVNPAAVGFTDQFDADLDTGEWVPRPELDLGGHTWELNSDWLQQVGQGPAVREGYPMFFQAGQGQQEFSVQAYGSGLWYIYLGWTPDNAGYYAVINSLDENLTISRMSASGVEVPLANVDAAWNDSQFRFTLAASGSSSTISVHLDGVELTSVTDTPGFTPGTRAGFGPAAGQDELYFNELIVTGSGSPAFDPASPAWVSLSGEDSTLQARLSALETQQASALHFRGPWVAGAHAANDLVTHEGQLYRGLLAHTDEAWDAADWEAFPPG